ncbi:ABC transporter substrate-binding protein [Undibacterium cyanobacteriorum]|uniref:ABC transporter substrate-binding protein n=1 Tax=Undibacterium cyanobacteriorum TaxID=3073561 RepID=A0ABY9RHE3_9BURK|nr:ABC transporter substrate-binding protein [Undibacterium sp. 20NA77.5]WMW80284.1 ABC transporter substrate-binding protein [Undibacterium sp. 20NA77.5]
MRTIALRRAIHALSFLSLLSCWQHCFANDRPLLRGLTSEDAYPYNFQMRQKIDGLVFEIAKLLTSRSGYELKVEAQPWTRALQTAKDNPNVLVFSLARNPEREQHYHWIGPVTTSEVWLFKLKSRTDLQITKLEEVKSYTIGDVASSSTIALLQKHGAKIDPAPSNLSNCRKFKAGRVDLIPFDPNGIKIFLHTCGLKPEDVEQSLHLPRDTALYIALGKRSDAELVQQLQQQFQNIIKDKSLQRLHEQWKIPYKNP